MEAVTVESRGHSGGWPQRWAKYDSWFFMACFILVTPRFHKFPFAVVMDCGGTEWASGYWVQDGKAAVCGDLMNTGRCLWLWTMAACGGTVSQQPIWQE